MIFTIVILALIALVTYFHYLQGFISALMSAIIAAIAASLALGWQETVVEMLKGKAPDYANALATVALFAVIYALLRAISDRLVPGNISLPLYVERAGAALLGLVAALFSIGTLAVAAQMLPFGPSVLGYTRFDQGPDRQVQVPPTGGGYSMQDEVVSGELKPEFEHLKPQTQGSGMLLPVDDMLVSFVSSMSNGLLSNGRPLTAVHPALLDELEGQRLGLMPGAKHTALNLDPHADVRVSRVWLADTLNEADGEIEAERRGLKFDIAPVLRPAPDEAIVVIRVELGPDAGDDDHNFRFSAGSIRLVAGPDDARKNYYPLGTLDVGGGLRVARSDDYLVATNDGKPLDLVFLVNKADVLKTQPVAGTTAAGKRAAPTAAGFTDGTFLEVKRNARVDLTDQPIGSPQMVVATAIIHKKGMPALMAGPQMTVAPSGGGSIFGGVELLTGQDIKTSATFPFSINVGRHDGATATLGSVSATLAGDQFTKLKIEPVDAISAMARGDFLISKLGVPRPNQRVVQVHAKLQPKHPRPWEWAGDLKDIQLIDAQQQTYACHGAAAKLLPMGVPKLVAAYDSTAPVMTLPEQENPPTDVWLFYVVPSGTEIAGLKVKNVLQPMALTVQ